MSLSPPLSPAAAGGSAVNEFMAKVVTGANLRRALRRVVANRGAPGCDGMTVRRLVREWPRWRARIIHRLTTGTYRVSPIRRRAVPKPDGGERILGIPTVLDRVVQQALARPLGALLDPGFSPSSFGFRPGRGAHDALRHVARRVGAGRPWMLHLDLRRFFDHAPHDLVLAALRAKVRDPHVLAVVERFLSAPFADGSPRPPGLGLPQGGPLSPLLSNLLLDALDRHLAEAGQVFCRYADDLCLLHTTEEEGRMVLARIAPWIEDSLRLPINRAKTRLAPVACSVFLGHRLRPRQGGTILLTPSPAACRRLRSAIRRLRLKLCPARAHTLAHRLVRGWSAYFRLAPPGLLRARIRSLRLDLTPQARAPSQAKVANGRITRAVWRSAINRCGLYFPPCPAPRTGRNSADLRSLVPLPAPTDTDDVLSRPAPVFTQQPTTHIHHHAQMFTLR